MSLCLLVLLFAVFVHAQMGPQLLFPKSPASVIEGPKEMNYLSMKANAVRQSMDVNPIAANNKPFYTPPVQMSIRGMIKTFGGVDPIGKNSQFTLSDFSSSHIIASNPMKALGKPEWKELPSIDEYKGLGGDARYPPRGLDFQPLGTKVFQIPDGPYTGFLEVGSDVNAELGADQLVDHHPTSSTADMDLKKELSALLAVGAKLNLNDAAVSGSSARAQSQVNALSASNMVKPVFVRVLGGVPVQEVHAQEAALLEQANAALEEYDSVSSEVDRAADSAEKAEAAWEEDQKAISLAETQAHAAEEQAVEEVTAMEARMDVSQKVPAGQSFLQASIEAQATADAEAQSEIDALAEAVAADTIQRQSALTANAISRLQAEIRVAKEKASARSLKPWWETKEGRQQNAANKVQHHQSSASAFVQSASTVHVNTAPVWNPPSAARSDPTAFMRPVSTQAYGAVPALHSSFLAVGASTELSTESPPAASTGLLSPTVGAPVAAVNMYANPVPTSKTIQLQALANPYSFSTADILYPQLRGPMLGSSGAPLAQAPANRNPPPKIVPEAKGGNTIVINVSTPPSLQMPNPSVGAVRHPLAGMPGTVPVGTGNNPFSLFPNAPAPSRVLSTGAPLPGSSISDNGSFGSLKV